MQHLTIEYYRSFLNDCANYLFDDEWIGDRIADIKLGIATLQGSVQWDNEAALGAI